MRLLIMGAPGAGKGTQATAIAEHYSVPAISTGDMFRTNIKNGTELGKKVKALDAYLKEHGQRLDAVISLDVDPELLTQRLLKRAEIEGRADDNEETIRNRMKVYSSQTEPLLEHYRSAGILVPVDGVGEIDEVRQRIFAALDSKN